jgi:hypothetical protein
MTKSTAVTFVLFVLVAATCQAADVGMNYNWWRVSLDRIGDCLRHPAGVFRGGGIVPQYDNAEVRHTVQQQLHEMRQAGFTSIKTFLMYRHQDVRDPLDGTLFSADGSIPAPDQKRIQQFISDISSADFHSIEVSFGFSGQNAPFCRERDWGDCFAPQALEENWRFISDGVQAVLSARRPPVLRFDLTSEGCPGPTMPAPTLAKVKRYLQTIVGRFQSKFPGNIWVVSCPDSPRAVRLGTLLSDLAEAGLRPKYVEVKSYNTNPRYIEDLLNATYAMSRSVGAEIVFGEMGYHAGAEAAEIEAWLRRNPAAPLIDVMEWPQASKLMGCPVDTAPPYTPGPIGVFSRPFG